MLFPNRFSAEHTGSLSTSFKRKHVAHRYAIEVCGFFIFYKYRGHVIYLVYLVLTASFVNDVVRCVKLMCPSVSLQPQTFLHVRGCWCRRWARTDSRCLQPHHKAWIKKKLHQAVQSFIVIFWADKIDETIDMPSSTGEIKSVFTFEIDRNLPYGNDGG